MSQENVKVVRSMYEAFAKGDVPTIIAALDPQVSVVEHGRTAEGDADVLEAEEGHRKPLSWSVGAGEV